MRIGIFTDSYQPIISGVTVSIGVLEKELKKLGHEVIIVTNDHDDALPQDNVIRIKGMRVPLKGLTEYRIGKVTRKKVKTMGLQNFDIIHCHTEFTIGRLGRCVAKKHNIPLVHTYHTMYEEYVHFISKTFAKSLRFLSKRYFKSFANSSDMVIFPTNKVKSTFVKYGYKKDSRTIPTGIYIENFRRINFKKTEVDELKASLGYNEDDFILLFLGRMSKEKSVEELIINYKNISQKNVKLLLVGGGPDLQHFKDIVKNLDLEDRVSFTGMIDRSKIGMYYQLGDLFVNFSMTETQGLTYCEALASGLPLFVKYDSNLDGVIENGINGYSFKSNDEFLPTFNKIYSNPIIFSEITTKASKGSEKFTASTYATRVLKIYNDLLEKNKISKN